MQDIAILEHFCSKEPLYKELEAKSEIVSKHQSGEFLCIRLDGIGLSKKYLKDNISNGKFENVIKQSVNEMYSILKKRTSTNAQNQFLCIFTSSDEVNVIFNSHPNYFDNRLYKSVTTTASIFSSLFTKNGNSDNFFGAFDGRPLIFNSIPDVCEYLSSRYAVYIRNTMTKILRLKINKINDSDLYASNNQNNFEYLTKAIEQNDLQKLQLSIPKHCRIYIPTSNGKLEECKYDSINDFTESIESKVNIFNDWLNKKNA